MDKSYTYQYISWDNLKTIPGKSKDETFELLCADFMKIKYNLSKPPAIWGKTYKWTEWPPEKWPDGLMYGFQSKFADNSFWNKKEWWLYSSCENIWDGTQYLCIFTKNDEPSDKTTSTPYVVGSCPPTNKTAWDAYLENLKITKSIKQIEKFCWDSFIKELKQSDYFEICEIYFKIDMWEIYRKSANKDDVCPVQLAEDVSNVEKWFEGDSNFYKKDLQRAQVIQKWYSYKKLAYSSKPWIWKKFDVLEKEVADKLFHELGFFWYFTSLKDYYDNWIDLLEDSNDLKKYSSELEDLLDSKRWLFVNYWTQEWSCLNYLWEDKIEFKDKRNAGNL